MFTPLAGASWRVPCQVTELIDLGADIQAKTAKGSSAMAIADKNGHQNIASAESLLEELEPEAARKIIKFQRTIIKFYRNKIRMAPPLGGVRYTTDG